MTFKLLPGLPGKGPLPEQFTYAEKRTHSEGTVVSFSDGTSSWVGNFQPAIGTHSGVVAHPNGEHVIVISGGEGYIVDPASRKLVEIFGGAINGLWVIDGDLVVFDDSGVRLSALDSTGWRWQTSRISWDGFSDIHVARDSITGHAWNAIEQRWEPFTVNSRDGTVTGAAYVEFGDRVI